MSPSYSSQRQGGPGLPAKSGRSTPLMAKAGKLWSTGAIDGREEGTVRLIVLQFAIVNRATAQAVKDFKLPMINKVETKKAMRSREIFPTSSYILASYF